MNDLIRQRRDELIKRFTGMRASVLGYIRILTRDIHLAEDLFQELSIVVMNKTDEFDPSKGTFESWIRGIAHNLARNALRKEKYIHLMPSPELSEALESTYENSDREEIERVSLRLRFLEICLKKVGAAARELLMLRYCRGNSLKQIAEATGKPPGTVQVALSRVRDALFKCVSKQERMTAHE
jgi:RNA polymerase sigma-70 factor (ECF subfamily)